MAEPVERLSTTRIIRKIGGSFTPSIKDALAGNLNSPKAEPVEQKNIFTDYQKQIESFTDEQLTDAWNRYLETITDRPSLMSVLSGVPERDGAQLTLKVGSSVQEGEVRQIKPELVNWLRTELKNDDIEIITKFERFENERVLFSDSEKLVAMIQRNPELLELKKRFDLDFKD